MFKKPLFVFTCSHSVDVALPRFWAGFSSKPDECNLLRLVLTIKPVNHVQGCKVLHARPCQKLFWCHGHAGCSLSPVGYVLSEDLIASVGMSVLCFVGHRPVITMSSAFNSSKCISYPSSLRRYSKDVCFCLRLLSFCSASSFCCCALFLSIITSIRSSKFP